MRSKRAQTAIEFLTTYGWSFVVLASVLGLMGYFGVISMGDRLPSQCSFDESFLCSAYIAQNDGSFAFEVINQESREINITKVLCIFPRSDEALLINLSSNEYTLARGDNITISCDHSDLGSNSLKVNKKDHFQAKIIYHDNIQGSLPDIATAEIVSDTVSDKTIYNNYYDSGSAIRCGYNSYTCRSWSTT